MMINYTIDAGGLKQNRDLSGMSQAELAEKTGISVRMIQNYEQGTNDINGAKLSTLLRLCLALGCTLEGIITDPETRELLQKYEEL